jgi:hypothetical protein
MDGMRGSKLMQEEEEDFLPNEAEARAAADGAYDAAFVFLQEHQAKHDFEVKIRIGNPQIEERVKDLIFECLYLYPAYERSKFHVEDRLFGKIAASAAIDARQLLALLDGFPAEVLRRHLVGKTRRHTILAPSVRRSLVALIDYCDGRAFNAASPGRKPNDVLQLITEDVVNLFEFWVGRGFRKNLALNREGFTAPDAECIAILLERVSPAITRVQVRSALKAIPKRNTIIQKRTAETSI